MLGHTLYLIVTCTEELPFLVHTGTLKPRPARSIGSKDSTALCAWQPWYHRTACAGSSIAHARGWGGICSGDTLPRVLAGELWMISSSAYVSHL